MSTSISDFRSQIPGELCSNNMDAPDEYCFPQISSLNNRTKRVILWRIIVRLYEEDGMEIKFVSILDEYFNNTPMPPNIYGWIKVISKVEGGKVRDSMPTLVKNGKNIGRANETNVFCQTLRDANGLYNKQLRKSSQDESTTITTTQLLPPMLAQLKSEQIKPVDYSTRDVYIQRKLNGVRAVATLDRLAEEDYYVILYSRNRKLYVGLDYIKFDLKSILIQLLYAVEHIVYLDGELYVHGLNLQTISGIARREDNNDTDIQRLQYHVYDCFVPDKPELTYTERKKLLDNISYTEYIIKVETLLVESDLDVKKLFNQFHSQESYEGAILRINRPYKYSYNSYHSNHLLKIKPTFDAEFKIIGYSEGKKGKAKGALMFILETQNGKEFSVTPGLELAERKKIYESMSNVFEDKYKGKMLTVIFDEYSADGIPVRARTEGIRIRDDID